MTAKAMFQVPLFWVFTALFTLVGILITVIYTDARGDINQCFINVELMDARIHKLEQITEVRRTLDSVILAEVREIKQTLKDMR